MYGLDFGTSNSAIAVVDGGYVEVIPTGSPRVNLTTRSVLYFPETGQKVAYIGEEAVAQYVENEMRGRFIQSIKSLLRDPGFHGTVIRGWGTQRADDLVAHILGYLRRSANEHVERDIDSVVLGRPAQFSEDSAKERIAVERLVAAAKKAGFKDVHLQLEPIAAALHYEATLASEELVLVADLGGGTTDFTLMRLSPLRKNDSDRRSDILGSTGVYVGGDKFDSFLMLGRLLKYFGEGTSYISYEGKKLPIPNHILQTLGRWQHIPFLRNDRTADTIRMLMDRSSNREGIRRLRALIEENLGFALFQAIEGSKKTLSVEESADISFVESVISIHEKVTREEFNDLIRDSLGKFNSCIEDLLGRAGVTSDRVNSVFLTGGTSQIPMVRQFLEDKFGSENIRTSETFTSVVSGLALSSRLFT
jgi:hypothetical chaperone protein